MSHTNGHCCIVFSGQLSLGPFLAFHILSCCRGWRSGESGSAARVWCSHAPGLPYPLYRSGWSAKGASLPPKKVGGSQTPPDDQAHLGTTLWSMWTLRGRRAPSWSPPKLFRTLWYCRNPKVNFPYMKLYLRTIPKLLVISWITSKTPNNIRFHHFDLSHYYPSVGER
jgi:hypothetical protein